MVATYRGPFAVQLNEWLAALALFALLAPTAGLLANPDFAGWAVGHGHAGNAAAVANHSHPYEHDHGAAQASDDTAASDVSDVTFTPADDAGIAAALVLASEPAPLPVPAPPVAVAPSAGTIPIAGALDLVPTPPPRA